MSAAPASTSALAPRPDLSAAVCLASSETPPDPVQTTDLRLPILIAVATALACAVGVRALWRSKRRALGVSVVATLMIAAIPAALWLRRPPAVTVQKEDPCSVPSVAAPMPPLRSVAESSRATATEGSPYLRPREATLVIAHGLIADALVGAFATAGQPLGDEAIRAEIGFPTTTPTAGMRYAVDHYEQDGWGRPFQLTHRGWKARISSMGEDGLAGTVDDIVVELARAQRKSWSWVEKKHAFFVQARSDQTVFFYHREPGKQTDRVFLAQELTGQSLFGVFLDSDFRSGALAKLLSSLAEPPGNSLVMAVLPVEYNYD